MPIDPFKAAAAGVGMVNVPKDRDGAVRRAFIEGEDQPSLPRVAARLTGAAGLPEPGGEAQWLRFHGPPQSSLSRISYSDALAQPDGYFRDKFVFIGSAPRVKRPGEEVDFFRTPYTRWSGEEAPGVALLATAFLNLIHGESITRLSWFIELAVLLLIALVARIPDHALLRAVGRGAYGEVWLARNASGLFHAVNIIYRRAFENDAPYEREFRGVTKFMPICRVVFILRGAVSPVIEEAPISIWGRFRCLSRAPTRRFDERPLTERRRSAGCGGASESGLRREIELSRNFL